MRLTLTFLLFCSLLCPTLSAQDDQAAGLFTEARQLPLVSQSLTVRITGGEAVVEIVQVFANEGDEIAQADYRLHLPDGAVVSAFGFWRSGRFLAAELKEKEEARAAHAAAASQGRATALLEREGTVHSFSVYPVPAGALQQVETTIRLPVATESGRSHLRLPIDVFLGHAKVTSSVVLHLETEEPLEAFGVDGTTTKTLDRGEDWARLALSSRESVEIWWSQEAPPLLTRAEAVPLEDGSFAVRLRVVPNDAGEWSAEYRELVVLVDTSFSMRRRSGALADLVHRVLDRAPRPVRFVSLAERPVEIGASDRGELVRRLLDGTAGFRSSWNDLVGAAAFFGCSDPEVRCVAVTDPQIDGLGSSSAADFETLLLADADELVYFTAVLPEQALVYQPDAEPRGELYALVDETVLPVLEVAAVEQRGGTFEISGSPRRRVAEGGLLRLFASSRSTEPLDVRLAIGGHEIERSVALDLVSEESRQGRAIRRGYFTGLLGSWTAAYRRSRDPELRQQIVDVSLRERIPTELTSLHVAEPPSVATGGTLPRTATPAPLARLLGWILLLAGAVTLRWSRSSRRVANEESPS